MFPGQEGDWSHPWDRPPPKPFLLPWDCPGQFSPSAWVNILALTSKEAAEVRTARLGPRGGPCWGLVPVA